jgi:hypothetical protein
MSMPLRLVPVLIGKTMRRFVYLTPHRLQRLYREDHKALPVMYW